MASKVQTAGSSRFSLLQDRASPVPPGEAAQICKALLAKTLALLLPHDWEGLQDLREASRRPAVENALDDVGRKERQAQHAADVREAYSLCRC